MVKNFRLVVKFLPSHIICDNNVDLIGHKQNKKPLTLFKRWAAFVSGNPDYNADFSSIDLDGIHGTAFRRLLSLAFVFRCDLIPGGSHAFVRHGEDGRADARAQTAADAVGVDMCVHFLRSFPKGIVSLPRSRSTHTGNGREKHNKKRKNT